MRRVALVAFAVGALLAASGAAAADSSGVRVVEAKGPPFPVRTFVVSLSTGRGLTIHGIRVTENGNPVVDPTLTPASQASKKTFGVVLVLDTSFSMAGKPLAAATRCRAGVRRDAQHEGAGRRDRLQPQGDDRAAADDVVEQDLGGARLDTAGLRRDSHLRRRPPGRVDAQAGAHQLRLDRRPLRRRGHRQQEDHRPGRSDPPTRTTCGSTRSASTTPSTTRGTLKALAAAGHGVYAQAKAQNLTPLFHKLGRTLSNEYLLQYKSLAKPNVPVHVDVSVNGAGQAGQRLPDARPAGHAPGGSGVQAVDRQPDLGLDDHDAVHHPARSRRHRAARVRRVPASPDETSRRGWPSSSRSASSSATGFPVDRHRFRIPTQSVLGSRRRRPPWIASGTCSRSRRSTSSPS